MVSFKQSHNHLNKVVLFIQFPEDTPQCHNTMSFLWVVNESNKTHGTSVILICPKTCTRILYNGLTSYCYIKSEKYILERHYNQYLKQYTDATHKLFILYLFQLQYSFDVSQFSYNALIFLKAPQRQYCLWRVGVCLTVKMIQVKPFYTQTQLVLDRLATFFKKITDARERQQKVIILIASKCL